MSYVSMFRCVLACCVALCCVLNVLSVRRVFQVTRRPNFKELAQDHARCQRWLHKKHIKAFYTPVFSDNLRHGTQVLLQVNSQGPPLRFSLPTILYIPL